MPSGPPATAIFEVGKTSVRLCAVDDSGAALATLERPNVVLPAPPYPHFDTDGLYQWLLSGLATLARDFAVHSIVPVTHGACAALVGEQALALPVMDYEFQGMSELDHEYDNLARDFSHTASPRLPAGLNLGRQLFWQQKTFSREFAAASIIPYPQYWAWRLSGVRAWEVTSLGCHTDLWEPRGGRFSNLAKTTGWNSRFARRVTAWTPLATVAPEIAATTGLERTCTVLAGIHDSNASYFAHRAMRAGPFCVLSTGTWIIVMARGSSLDVLREDRDMLANVDGFGSPVPTARFMGGREYAAIAGKDGLPSSAIADLERIIHGRTFALPSFCPNGGPFHASRGRIIGPPPTSAPEQAALASLYCALMADLSIEMLHGQGDVIVEGRFAANRAFCDALAALRAPQVVYTSDDQTGSLRGATMLSLKARGQLLHAPALMRWQPPYSGAIKSYCERWRRLLPPGATDFMTRPG